MPKPAKPACAHVAALLRCTHLSQALGKGPVALNINEATINEATAIVPPRLQNEITVSAGYSSSRASDAMTQPATSTKGSTTPESEAICSPRSRPNSSHSRTPSQPATGTLRVRGSLDFAIQQAWALAEPGGGHVQGARGLEVDLGAHVLQMEHAPGEDDWEENLVTCVLGDKVSYGYSPVRRIHAQHTEQPRSIHKEKETGGSDDEQPELTTAAAAGKTDAPPPPMTDTKPRLRGSEGWDQEAKEPGEAPTGYAESLVERVQLVRDILYNLVMIFIRLFGVKEQAPKPAVPILITAVKRLDRESRKSTKRVHFKLRKKSQQEAFKPLSKGSAIVQSWLMLMVVPLVFDVFAFGLRLAFCDIYLRKFLLVYFMDVTCDVVKILDMVVALVTVIPKYTHPGQQSSAVTLNAIARLYFRHQFAWNFLPLLLYQVTSLPMLQRPCTYIHH